VFWLENWCRCSQLLKRLEKASKDSHLGDNSLFYYMLVIFVIFVGHCERNDSFTVQWAAQNKIQTNVFVDQSKTVKFCWTGRGHFWC
jgi:hypothetical protein